MKISFLLHNGYGIGGTIRTTFNLAQALASRHEVEIISVLRHREQPHLALDPRVRMRALVDLAGEQDDPRHRRPPRVFPSGDSRRFQYSELTDERIAAALGALDADVAVGTRAGLNVHLALQAPGRVVKVAQEHLTLDGQPSRMRNAMRRVYPRLDAITCVTRADAAAYRRKLGLSGVRVEALPNSVPEPAVAPAEGRARVVIAAGRLHRVKRFDRLIEAWAQLAGRFPAWQLRIYGHGPERDALRRLIDARALNDQVFLMGPATPLEAEWVKGSIAVLTSEFEPFGMTLVEAMRCGLPVVATDCPHGPREIVADGQDGRLVPVGDRDALAGALAALMADGALRRRMGERARENAARFDPAPVVEHAERLFGELLAARRAGAPRRRAGLLRGVGAAVLSGGYAVRDLTWAAGAATLRTARRAR
ncbi:MULTISPECIES: glycosyltransferase family 4 protein [Streptomyces]|uniref:D-inositol 3-phosphate glycosyltransferase n=2 Tax=Streptomyces TaxID=1883 RepID=A0A1I6QQW1_9ACTN|nr:MULTISPECIES: glycosyltransferase family 4 protein [Streptomyces]QKV67948.1 glycosyltransferase family 4 protein [Streptomyces harbinensis]SFS54785.1 Glycosyltransferase involved in cell wall bisynthesis [Streptomyces harbinensis]